jgi:hypothetical protein
MMSRVYRRIAGLTTIALLIATGVNANSTYYVSILSGDDIQDGLTWPTAKKTIQNAITAASSGDTVVVSNGVYYLASELVISNAVTLLGVGGPTNTIIDGSNACRCIRIENGEVKIEGFSIRNGFLSGEDDGAGVLSLYGGVLRDCHIYGNVTSNESMFVQNVGGGIYFQGGTIEQCTIYSNSTTSGYGGGGVYLEDSGTVMQCEVYGNYSMGSGGGIRCSGGTVEDCAIYNNSAGWGGGVSVGGDSIFVRCSIHNNSAGAVWLNGWNGGAIRNSLIYSNDDYGVVVKYGTMRDCLIYGNVNAGVRIETEEATVENCTISGNGEGVSVREGNLVTNVFRNLVLYGNFTGSNRKEYVCETNSVFSCDFSCVIPIPSNGIGNIDADPLFADTAQSDFRLRAGSPCIDAGTNLDWMTTAIDMEGHPRIFNGRVDMGADETFVALQDINCTGQVATSWQTVIDARYQLQSSTNLLSTNWNNIGSISTALQWQVSHIDTNSIAPARFYRLLWLRP